MTAKRPMSKAFLILSLFTILLLGFSFPGADQPDFPDIYIDEGCAGTHVGSSDNPYDALSEINWTTGGDNSIFDYLAGEPSASPTIHLNKGDTWREQLTVGASGTATYPIVITSYGDGADPIINGSSLATTWTKYEGEIVEIWGERTGADHTGVTDDTHIFSANADTNYEDNNIVVYDYDGIGDKYAGFLRFDLSAGTGAFSSAELTIFPNYEEGTSLVETYLCTRAWVAATATWNNYDGVNSWGATHDRSTFLFSYNIGVADDDTDQDWSSAALNTAVDTIYGSGSLNLMIYTNDANFISFRDSTEAGNAPYLSVTTVADNNIYQKTFTNEPKVVLEDGTLLTFIGWDTDIATTATSMSAGTFTVDTTNKIAYVWCTDDADPDTHTMEVSAETGDDGYVIKCTDVSYITIDGIDVTQGIRSDICVDSSPGTDVSNVIIQNCIFRYSGEDGVQIMNWANKNVVHPITDCTIDSCTVHHNRLHGIELDFHVTNSVISNNTVYNNAWNQPFGFHGISSWSNDADSYPHGNIVENNEVYNTYNATDGGEGAGIQMDELTRNTIIRYNVVYNNEGSGFATNIAQDNQWYCNLVYGNGLEGSEAGMQFIEATGDTVYNNVFYDNYNGLSMINSSANLTIKNNIFSENTVREIIVDSDSTTGETIDYNCIYHSGGGTFMNWNGTDYNWADWKTASSQDAHSIDDDPLMIDPANNNFHLNPHSPCVNAGTDVSLTEDYEGLKIRHAPDIGAHENQANVLFFSWFLKDFLGVNK